eukprot:COSAG05_NODE_18031_length_315_cov_0.712963_1_plen_27_part_10
MIGDDIPARPPCHKQWESGMEEDNEIR